MTATIFDLAELRDAGIQLTPDALAELAEQERAAELAERQAKATATAMRKLAEETTAAYPEYQQKLIEAAQQYQHAFQVALMARNQMEADVRQARLHGADSGLKIPERISVRIASGDLRDLRYLPAKIKTIPLGDV